LPSCGPRWCLSGEGKKSSLETYPAHSPCFPSMHAPDGDKYFVGHLTKAKLGLVTTLGKELPTISWSCMKKAGMTVTPRRMPSSTSS
jgi:hypothetical protein